MKPQALVIDLDDTLLDAGHAISDGNRAALRELAASGVHVVLCSGRPTVSVKKYVAELFGPSGKARESYYISFNGARVDRWDSGEQLYLKGIPAALAGEIVRFADEQGVVAQSYEGDEFLVNRDGPEAEHYRASTGMSYRAFADLADRIEHDPPKILLHSTAGRIADITPLARDRFGDRLTVAPSKPIYLEFMHREVNKAAAMESLMKRLDIAMENTVAVGDSINDMEMIEAAGIGIAVANARDELKEAADAVLSHRHDEDALAFVAASYF